MPDEMVIRHCAPTLASIKTGSLFSCPFEGEGRMGESIRSLNRRLRGKGLRVLPMRCRGGRCLVYVYRPAQLARDLSDARAQGILRACGYPGEGTDRCVRRLIERLHTCEAFPHEIGLFLGYPPEDVEGFMTRRQEAKCVGCWKVYGDVAAAKRLFERYARCTDAYLRRHAQGTDIERLAVAV